MKILMVIAKTDFRDEEFLIPHNYFIGKGFEVEVVSSERGICIGSHGAEVEAELSFEDVNTLDFNAVVLVGGSGSVSLDENLDLEKILFEARDNDLIIGAICRSPVILAKAGLLKGHKVTVYPSDENIKEIKDDGAEYVAEGVVIDNKLVTADGPESAEEYASCIVILLKHGTCNK